MNSKVQNQLPWFFLFIGLFLLMGSEVLLAEKANNTLKISWQRELESLNRYFNTAREGVIVSRHVNDDLIYRDPVTNEYKPLLAESFEWINDTTLEFELRKGITFHNGEVFNADDVVFTVNFVSNPDSRVLVQRNVNWIKNAEKLGPYSVRIHLKQPFPMALDFLAGNVPIFPNEYYQKVGTDGYGAKPIGTGPYMVVENEPGRKIVFKRNQNYFKDSPKGQPMIEKIIQKTIPETTTMIAELITGGLDWLFMVPNDQAEKLKGFPNITVLKGETTRIGYLGMDSSGRSGNTPFKNKKIREAISYAIDREAIAKSLLGGQSRVVHAACFPEQFGCTDSVRKYTYNPKKAKQLMKEAGYPNGIDIELYSYRNRPIAEAFLSYLNKAGIRTKLKHMAYAAWDAEYRAGKTALVFGTWGSYGIMDTGAITSQFFKFEDRDYDRDKQVRDWLDMADNSVNPKVRKEGYNKALNRIADQAYWLPLFTYVSNYAFDKDLKFTSQPDNIPRFFLAEWK